MGQNAPPAEWNATKYHTVSDPQFRWGQAVLERLGRLGLRGDEVIVDAGCGTGRLTAELLQRFPNATIVAVDGSRSMLEVAEKELARFGDRVSFVHADLEAWHDDARADVVFSTATFHWIKNHPKLFGNLHRTLCAGGWLLAQCGGEGNLALHHARCNELMQTAAFAPHFTAWAGPWEFASADLTRRRLADAGFVRIETSIEPADVFFTNADDFREFVTTVIFRPHLAHLPNETLRTEFLRHMTELSSKDDPPFRLDYKRLNMLAQRAD
jgi:trans-aconitate methyltransferase